MVSRKRDDDEKRPSDEDVHKLLFGEEPKARDEEEAPELPPRDTEDEEEYSDQDDALDWGEESSFEHDEDEELETSDEEDLAIHEETRRRAAGGPPPRPDNLRRLDRPSVVRPGAEQFSQRNDITPLNLLSDNAKSWRQDNGIKLHNTKTPRKTYGKTHFSNKEVKVTKTKMSFTEKLKSPQDQAACDKMIEAASKQMREPLVISGKPEERAMLVKSCEKQGVRFIEKKTKKEIKAEEKAAREATREATQQRGIQLN